MNITMNPALSRVAKKRIALEGTSQMRIINVDDEPMKVQIITDKIITANELKPVTNPIMFERGQIPTSNGLFSEYIFGTTQEERMKNYAYVDLQFKFFHPYVFEVIKKVQRNFEKAAAGESAWAIDEDGSLIEIKDENDPRYNEDNTGITWLVNNYHYIKFKTNESIGRKENLTFLNGLTDDEIFITKWLVVPVFYRDIDTSQGRALPHEINQEYNYLIRMSNMLTRDAIGFLNNKTMYNIQLTLIKIRKYGQSLIEKKNGEFHKSVLGKSIDNGVRAVISVPVMNDVDLPEDNPVDIFHTGIPLAQCLILGYQFMMKWCLDFFRREFDGVSKRSMYIKNETTNEYELTDVQIDDQMGIFTTDFLRRKMKGYINTYGSRFEPIQIQLKDGRMVSMVFTGRAMSRNIKSPDASTISGRPMTWTDLFYMAAMETLTDKHVYCTRYPLSSYFGIFPSKCIPVSTVKTMVVKIGDTIYKHYPVVELGKTQEEVSTLFIDTAEISNLYLSAVGGDYDGDQISIKMVYSLEANKEANEILNSLKHFMSMQGNIIRDVGNEAYLTFYTMTKRK